MINDGMYVIWVSLFSSRQVKYSLTRPDGRVEVNFSRFYAVFNLLVFDDAIHFSLHLTL